MFRTEDIGWIVRFCEDKVSHLLLAPGSSFSLASLSSALLIAISFILWRRRHRKREVAFRVMLRALFPGWLYRHDSFKADFGFLLFNVFAWGIWFGWAAISANYYADVSAGVLTNLFGSLAPPRLPVIVSRSAGTIVLFLAYELGYWTYHYLSHRIPLLWEFHKVHHTAEILTPMTNYRVHPVDTIVFYNVLAVIVGFAGGVLGYLLGPASNPFALSGTNLILAGFLFATIHLQHSHVWIPTTGRMGRVLLSPAHHQLHHSTNPLHFNKNLGSCLAVWDWLFGTLQIPTRERQKLTFGIEPASARHHTPFGAMLLPFFAVLTKMLPRRRQSLPATPPAIEI